MNFAWRISISLAYAVGTGISVGRVRKTSMEVQVIHNNETIQRLITYLYAKPSQKHNISSDWKSCNYTTQRETRLLRTRDISDLSILSKYLSILKIYPFQSNNFSHLYIFKSSLNTLTIHFDDREM